MIALSLIANHLWQSTLFAGLVGVLALTLRTNRARLRYALWMAASLKFLVPFSLLIVVCRTTACPPHPRGTPPAVSH